MTAPRLTRARLKAACACYSTKKIARLVPRSGLTIQQVAALKIPIEDRAWALENACAWEGASALRARTQKQVRTRLFDARMFEARFEAAHLAACVRLVALAARGFVDLAGLP